MNKEIINDQKDTIHRLQQECTEKTNAIIVLGEQLKAKEQECERLSLEKFVLKDELEHTKFVLETATGTVKFKEQQLDQLKAENEELKKDVERWKSNFNGKVSAIEELIKIIQQALEDFSIEVGTPQYDRLLNSAKSLGIEVKDYE